MSSSLKIFLAFGFLLLLINTATAQRSFIFAENKNQWNPAVLYKADIPGGNLYLEKNCFTYNFVNSDDLKHSHAHHHSAESDHGSQSSIIHYHAYRVKFLGLKSDVVVKSDVEAPDYCNYFIGKDKSKWASKVHKYDVVNYQRIYENIDLKVYTSDHKLKYDFNVFTGGNTENIKLFFEGVDDISLKDGHLLIKTSVNEITELKPFAYQEIKGIKTEVKCNYKLKDNVLSFEFPEGYQKNALLVIDPTLVFSTYTGSTSDNWGFTATYDQSGNVYSGGIVESSGYPVNSGAYQIYNGGIWDVGIIKYNPQGTNKLFATYLGGSSSDIPHSLVVNELNELHIFGTTGSNDFPVTTNAYDTTFNGGDSVIYDNTVIFYKGTDIYVSKLSEDGSQLLGSTYVGGSGNDGLNYQLYMETNGALMQGNDSLYYNYGDGARGEIITDSRNNVYIGTCTFSPNFPVTNGAFQTQYKGKEEGVIFKLNSSLTSMVWSSYIGGSEADAVYSVDVDDKFDVYIAGGSVSHDFPTTPGVLHPSFIGGTTDGFVAHISANGQSLIKSTYWGSVAYDQIYFVRLDKNKNIYITGQTEASGTTLIQNAVYNRPNSGQFIAKLNNSLDNIIWSTVFGTGSGKPNISITAFTVDVCNRLYLSGWGRIWGDYTLNGISYPWGSTFGTKGMDITSDAYQNTTDGQDFYIMVLADDASQLDYATYFGEPHYNTCYYSGHDHVDGGTSRFDRKGNIYQSVCASCGGCQQFPTYPSPGVWSPTNNAYNCNNAVFRFSFMNDFSVADFNFPPTGCAPYLINFTNTSIGTTYHWNFGDGNTSSDVNPSHTYLTSGVFNVTLIASNPASCNLADTIVKQIEVFSNTKDTIATVTVCLGDSLPIGITPSADPGVTYHWTPQTGLSNPNIANPYVHVNATTQYLLVATKGNCKDSMIQIVQVPTGVYSIHAVNDTVICDGSSVTLSASANNPTLSYLWSLSHNFSTPLNTNTTSSNLTVSPLANTTYFIKGNGTACVGYGIDSVTVRVNRVTIQAWPDTSICSGDTIQLHVQNLISGNVLTHYWTPATGIISGDSTATPVVSPPGTISYIVHSHSQYGCTKTDTLHVTVDVVSASIPSHTNVKCKGNCNGMASASGTGTSPLIYQWNNGLSVSMISNLCPGTYTVTVTDNKGCKKSASINITEPAQLLSSVQEFPILVCQMTCTGQIVSSPAGGTPPYMYHWSNNASNDTISGLCVGTYLITITDANGCFTQNQGQITDPSDLMLTNPNMLSPSCHGFCDGSLSVSASGGQAPLLYHWNGGQNTSNITGVCSGNYNVSVSDAQNCIRTHTFSLSQPLSLDPYILATSGIKCHDDTTTLTVATLGGYPTFTYIWSDSLHHTTQSIHGIKPGAYSVTVFDSHSCPDSTAINVVNPPYFKSDSLKMDVACSSVCNGAIHLGLSGGVYPYSVFWNDSKTDSVRKNLCPGDYYATITDSKLCQKKVHFHIDTLNYVPPLNASADTIVIYRGLSTVLHANGLADASYVWAPAIWLNDPNSKDPKVTPLNTKLYQVWTTDSIGCKNSDTITIFVKDVLCREPYVYIPNAFTPNNDGNNDKLFVQSNVVSSLYFAVYDRWGEVVFETKNIQEGWDGTYKGKDLEPAVFVYYLKVSCLNGELFEKKGNVTLLR